ncbi:C4-dicarboxylate TRAP transporter substrate-binding protein [Serratia liquefaciens]|uniref:C4-dicarboxylate TRAP transporter substrate-binding protein n=1 Tax=Serratia liquefaciens TaxID=614 RepID=UPI002182F58A|nr:C4-dicarboxylate TRAP transporter substrate-binding protein [Serratia liquefaciens]CAI2508563.1 Extracytoplasmic solute receptor protein yiaO [Serratia liquefaciens]
MKGQLKQWVILTCALFSLLVFSTESISAKYTIRVSYENNPGEPFDLAVKKWAELFKEKTNGQGELVLFPSSSLGSKKDVMEQIKLGSAMITLADGAFFADYLPDFGIMMGPYLGRDYNDIFTLTKTPWFADLSRQLDDKGFHILAANWLYGIRQMVVNKPIHTPADLKGVKIRVANSRIFIEAIKAMGATPTPMPLGEVYTALTTGVIDGAENPIPVLYGQKLFEPARYLIMTGHIDNVTQLIIGQKYYRQLPDNIKKALTLSCEEAGNYMTQLIIQADQQDREKMKAAGVRVIEVDRELFRQASKSAYQQFPEWTPGLYEKLQSYLE